MSAAVDVVIIGAGHAGLALGRRLLGGPHSVRILERAHVAASWRKRWDSFTLVTPNSLLALPGDSPAWPDPDAFLPRDRVIEWLQRYAAPLATHLREGVAVDQVARTDDGFTLHTSDGIVRARSVVVATGYGVPSIPSFSAALPPAIHQVHTDAYRAPDALPPGGVLVVGSGQSGVQIAAELVAAGRAVTVAVGACGWAPRRYLGKDILQWAQEVGFYDRRFTDLRNPRMSRGACQPQMTGQRGGETLNLAVLAARGAFLVGRVSGARGDTLEIDDTLEKSLRFGDEFAKNWMNTVDNHVRARGGTVASTGWHTLPWQGHVQSGQDVRSLSLEERGITSVVWATGYRRALSWIEDLPTDEDGFPVHTAGVTPVPGLFFLGLPFQTRRSSSLIHGVAADAASLHDAVRAFLSRVAQ